MSNYNAYTFLLYLCRYKVTIDNILWPCEHLILRFWLIWSRNQLLITFSWFRKNVSVCATIYFGDHLDTVNPITLKLVFLIPDCFVVGSRLVFILEEALWVLTDRQLGAALAFADSLACLARNASSQVTREKAQRKLEVLIYPL